MVQETFSVHSMMTNSDVYENKYHLFYQAVTMMSGNAIVATASLTAGCVMAGMTAAPMKMKQAAAVCHHAYTWFYHSITHHTISIHRFNLIHCSRISK